MSAQPIPIRARTLAALEPDLEHHLTDGERHAGIAALHYQAAGEILTDIKERRLYKRAGYGNFGEYCMQRWGLDRRRVSELRQAAEAVKDVRMSGHSLSKHQAIELARFPPNKRRRIQQADFAKISVRQLQTIRTSPLSVERYTPAHIVGCVLEILGQIDLDACSNPGTPNIPARRHFTKEDDGLKHHWDGRVYLNAPYQPSMTPWIEKAVAEYRSGRVTELIALIALRSESQWFQRLLSSFPICLVNRRIHFIGSYNNMPGASALVYMGKRHRRFAQVCDGKLGAVYVPYSWLK